MLMKVDFLFNPFEKIAGLPALIVGITTIIIAGLIAGNNGTHFPSFLTTILTVSTGWHVPIVEMLFIWSTLSVLGILACQFFGSAHYRVVDVLGTMAISRIPYIIITLGGYSFSSGLDASILQMIMLPLLLIIIGWSLALLYNALRISGNLKGRVLWISFTAVCLGTQIITNLFMDKIYLLIL